MSEKVVFSVLARHLDGNLQRQGLMSHDDNVWDLNSVAELRDQIIYLKIILVRILRKIT